MQQLKGVGVALVTPFQQDMAVDYAALERLIEYTLRGKADYLVTLGTTGEVATLSEEEQLAVLDFTLKTVAGRVPPCHRCRWLCIAHFENVYFPAALPALCASP